MKKTFTLKNLKHNFLFLFLLITTGSFMSCSVVESMPVEEINKAKISRKERTVKIYPDLIKRIMHVKNIVEKPVDLFVFEMDGTLIRHLKMDEGDHKKITGLERGAYVYQVFKGDEMSESGKINIK